MLRHAARVPHAAIDAYDKHGRMRMALHPEFGEDTVNELTLKFKGRQINLEPGFQRRSVWTLSDRRRLIQSIVAGYPVPSIFLYRRSHNGRLVYDVIDGKQRLETILMFTGLGRFRRDVFDVKLDFGNGLAWCDWAEIKRRHKDARAALLSYKLQTVEVTGDLSQIIDLFVRINATGKRLTSGEKRHARFYTSPFLREAEKLVDRYRSYLEGARVLSAGQIDRMKGTELFAELLMSFHNGGPINKKTSLDRAIGNDAVNGNTLSKLVREFHATIKLVRRMFPDLVQTRLRNSAEFYSLFLLVWEMDRDGRILSDQQRNKIAFQLLRQLSAGVDEYATSLEKQNRFGPASDFSLTTCLQFKEIRTAAQTENGGGNCSRGYYGVSMIEKMPIARSRQSKGDLSGILMTKRNVRGAERHLLGLSSAWIMCERGHGAVVRT